MIKPKLKFPAKKGKEFHKELRELVNEYFKTAQLPRTAPARVWLKNVLMLLLYFAPYVLAVSLFPENPFLYILMYALMGVGLVGIGMNIAHEANHGSISRFRSVNHLAGGVLYLLGIDQRIWKLEHNVEHHTFTNIHGYDSDIAVPSLLRLSPHQKRMKVHRFQHLYAWLLYGLITFRWATFGDFMRYVKNYRRGKFREDGAMWIGILKLIGWKLAYHAYIWVLPTMLFGVSWGVAIGAFLFLHLVSGMLLGTITQMGHIMPETQFHVPNDDNQVESQWAVHQMETTCNFGTRTGFLRLVTGGLNYQVEHHLFPNISSYHFPAISKIVEKVARKHGVPYYDYKSFFSAILAHARYLRWVGTRAE